MKENVINMGHYSVERIYIVLGCMEEDFVMVEDVLRPKSCMIEAWSIDDAIRIYKQNVPENVRKIKRKKW